MFEVTHHAHSLPFQVLCQGGQDGEPDDVEVVVGAGRCVGLIDIETHERPSFLRVQFPRHIDGRVRFALSEGVGEPTGWVDGEDLAADRYFAEFAVALRQLALEPHRDRRSRLPIGCHGHPVEVGKGDAGCSKGIPDPLGSRGDERGKGYAHEFRHDIPPSCSAAAVIRSSDRMCFGNRRESLGRFPPRAARTSQSPEEAQRRHSGRWRVPPLAFLTGGEPRGSHRAGSGRRVGVERGSYALSLSGSSTCLIPADPSCTV